MNMFPNLMSPIKIGSLTLKNRIESPPTGFMDSSPEGLMSDSAIEYYRMRAKGGAAIVTLGESYVDPDCGMSHPCNPRMFDPYIMPGLVKAAEAIKQYGSVPSIELLHPGMRSDVNMNRSGKAYGPSPIEGIFAYDHPVHELTEEMILDIIRRYGDAAAFAQDCGIEMVMVYGAHGFLIPQFLSPLYNHRTDAWGGSIENRCRLPLMIAQEIKRRCGKHFPVEFRLSAAEHVPGGYTVEDTIALCNYLEGNVDLINISNGSFGSKEAAKLTIGSNIFMPRGQNLEEAAQIKRAIKIPLSVVGGLNDPNLMEKIISEGMADMVAIARSLIADPFLPEKAAAGQEEDIRPCIRCNYCFSHNYIPLTPYAKRLARCAVNPLFGREVQYKQAQGLRHGPRRSVVIAGGGPAGMQAALTAAELGHSVTLFEKADRLGGLLNAATHASFKQDLEQYRRYMIRQVENCGDIKVNLGQALTPEKAEELAPDLLVIAVGSEPAIPPIPGTELPHVCTVNELPGINEEIGNHIVVIGGGLSGCEEALDLAQSGKNVTILEAADEILTALTFDDYLHKKDLVDELAKQEEAGTLHIHRRFRVSQITETSVIAADADGAEHVFRADRVILACGNRELKEVVNSLRSVKYHYAVIGDCYRARNLRSAVQEGFLSVVDI